MTSRDKNCRQNVSQRFINNDAPIITSISSPCVHNNEMNQLNDINNILMRSKLIQTRFNTRAQSYSKIVHCNISNIWIFQGLPNKQQNCNY